MSVAPQVEQLLMSGGDSRSVLRGQDGFTKYGCQFRPRPNLLALGSCTASSPSARSFRAVVHRIEQRRRDAPTGRRARAVADHFKEIRRRVKTAFVHDEHHDHVDVVLAPSGTDVEFLPLALMLDRDDDVEVTNIVVAPSEVGSGTVLAAKGQLFDPNTPAGPRRKFEPFCNDLHESVQRVDIRVRTADGRARPQGDVDREVDHAVEAALASGRQVLLHRVAHTKTGIFAPSITKVRELKERFGDRVQVIVDAAQGRICRRGITAALKRGSMLFVTGSKFYGGPPFSAALFVPRELRPEQAFGPQFGAFWSQDLFAESWADLVDRLPQRIDEGLALRWEAALTEIETYWSIDSDTRYKILMAFEEHLRGCLGTVDEIELCGVPPRRRCGKSQKHRLEGHQTVFAFRIRSGGQLWSKGELNELHAYLNTIERPFHLGQPVALGDGGGHALRAAIGAPLVNDVATRTELGASLDDRVHWLRDRLRELPGHLRDFIEAREISR